MDISIWIGISPEKIALSYGSSLLVLPSSLDQILRTKFVGLNSLDQVLRTKFVGAKKQECRYSKNRPKLTKLHFASA